ncbi:MAG TPA: sensor histidine kinase [Hymenobacter sp.]|uniref:sensor histidine kinase n=1 Tax=Hymenobacter sp. TaxID=1898978 RepID=UPI002D7E44BD|nr:sensor histidine kinase [Hymenobacter sp.]HET9503675.1 sensor histidine kinase [Hymenobacter sp.]
MPPFAVFLCLLLLAGFLPARGQSAAVTEQVRQLLQSSQALLRTDSAQAARLVRQALARSRALGFTEGIGGSYVMLGQLQAEHGHYAAAVALFQQAEQQLAAAYRAHPTPRLRYYLGLVANNIGSAEWEQDHALPSMVAYLRAADHFTATRNYDGLLVLYCNLADCAGDLGQRPQQLAYLQRALALQTQPLHHPEQLLPPYTSLVQLLVAQRRTAEAGHYLEQARLVMAQPEAERYRALYERTRGIYFFKTNRYPQAQVSFRRALADVRRQGNAKDEAGLLLELGRTSRRLGHYAAADAALRQGLRLARAQQSLSVQTQVLAELAALEEARGPQHAPAALAYFKQMKALEDQLAGEETKRSILQLEARYQTRQQQQQIAVLRAQRQTQQQELHRRATLNYAALALLAVLLGALALGYAALRARQKLAAQQQASQARKIEELEQERQRLATEAMLRGQDDERRRLARDLHDGLGGMLSTVKYYLGTVRAGLALPEASAQLFARALHHLDGATGELRRVARDMMPEALQQFGLVAALQDVCDALSHGQDLRVQFQTYGLAERLPQRIEVVVYRLVQELLHNALKHAQASQVIVQLVRTGAQMQVVVEDDGRGFDPAATSRGVGLHSIQARVDYLRGTLDLHSSPGQGTTATIDFSIPEA